MLFVSFYYDTVMHHEFVQGQTINQHLYLQVLRCFLDALPCKQLQKCGKFTMAMHLCSQPCLCGSY